MSLPSRRGLLAGVTVAATTVVVPFVGGTPAQAAGDAGTSQAVFVADTDGDGGYGLYRRLLAADGSPAGAPSPVVAESDASDISAFSTSPDGSRIAYVQDVYGANDGSGRQRLVVRDVGGRVVRVVEDRAMPYSPTAPVTFATTPSFSPDGADLVWTHVTMSSSSWTTSLLHAKVAGGAVATVPGSSGMSDAVYVAPGLVVGWSDTGATSLPAAGGTQRAVTGIDDSMGDIRMSPDGHSAAFSVYGSRTSSSIVVAPLTVNGTTVSFGTRDVVIATGYNMSPDWTDGGGLLFVRPDADDAGDIWRATPGSAGWTTAPLELTAADEPAVATAHSDATAPAAPVAAPALLAGTAATVAWSRPADTDLSGVLVTRLLGSTVQRDRVYVAAPATTFADTGLVVGKTYTYRLQAVDRSGNVSAAAVRSVTATLPPALKAADPTSSTATKTPFPVALTPAGNVAATRYTVDYRAVTSTAYSRWLTRAAGPSATFGAGNAPVTVAPGSVWQFQGRAYDAYGNATGLVRSAKAVVPFDQSKATFSGGTNATGTDRWLGGVRTIKATGNYAKLTVTADRVTVVGEKCPTCGKLYVYDGSTKVATVDSYASARKPRQVLYTRTWTKAGSHVLTVKPAATAGRPNVVLDAFAVRR